MSDVLIESMNDISTLAEMKNGKKEYFFEGICMQSEVYNGNTRKYQRWEMEREINLYNETKIAKNAAIGELDHSSSSTINLSKMSHKFITPLYMEGNDVICKARILENIWGQIIKTAIDEKIPFGLSSKGKGNLTKEEKGFTVHNFELITPADIVENPSAPDARPAVFAEMIIEAIVDRESKIVSLFNEEIAAIVRMNVLNSNKNNRDEIIIKEYNKLMRSI